LHKLARGEGEIVRAKTVWRKKWARTVVDRYHTPGSGPTQNL